jgi:hypothetical protein
MFDLAFVKLLQDYNSIHLYMINTKANFHQIEAKLKKNYRRIITHKCPNTELKDKMTLFKKEHPLFIDYYEDWWFDYYNKR